jgi:hypothetical protein
MYRRANAGEGDEGTGFNSINRNEGGLMALLGHQPGSLSGGPGVL